MADISNFKSQLTGGGARPSQFSTIITFPNWVAGGTLAGQQCQFLCKAASLPASTLENIGVMYRGRPVNFAGERTFSPWAISVYNDTSFNIRNAFEDWSRGIQSYSEIKGRTNPSDYQRDMIVNQLDRSGAIIKSYKFYDAYPADVDAIALDFDATNQIELFNVTFVYNFFEPI